MPVFRQPDGLVQGAAVENNSNHPSPPPSAPLASQAESRLERVQSPVTDPPPARPKDSEYLLQSA